SKTALQERGEPMLNAAVAVLQVRNVERSAQWYGSVLGFAADPFPPEPPHFFAILRRDGVELMLQCVEAPAAATAAAPGSDWSLYLRMSGGRLLELAQQIALRTPLLRGPERAFYGQVEFEVADPDGHLICIAEPLPAHVQVPERRES